MADVRITDPDDLTDAERQLLGELLDLPADAFDAAVSAFIRTPDEATRNVLQSSGLAQDTLGALQRLQAAAREAAENRQLKRAVREAAQQEASALAAYRRELRPYVSLAIAAAAANSPRRRAERILGKLRYGDLKRIQQMVEDGRSESDIIKFERDRLGVRE